VIGLEVPHAHVHLIPLNAMRDVNFSNAKLKLPKERMQELASKISEAVML
jgi:histidine triad (HIT) family protein